LKIRDDSWLKASQEALLRGDWKSALKCLPPHHLAFNDSDVLKHLCCVYLQAARWEKVISISAPAAQRFAQEGIFWECWAWAEHIQGETLLALRVLEFASERFPKREGVAYSLACLYAATNQLPKAQQWLARARKLNPDLPSFIAKVATQRELKILWTAQEHAFAT
jgi:tetratricopeptide (TPR) repeat protein